MMKDDHFRYATTIEVRWRDLDALGHVNNAVYLTYLEEARVHYMRELGLGFRSIDEVGIIFAEVTCTFLSPILLSEQVTIRVRVAELGRSSFVFDYQMEGEDGRVVARARSVQVCYDYEAERSIPIPERWRQLIIDYEPGLSEQQRG
jgi:acyl-CoA thioester hydrolase